MISILIVDDHAVVRAGLRAVLSGAPGYDVIGEAADANEGIALAGRERPDVVLLDITMPGGSGLEAVPRLLAAAPATRILMLSVHDKLEYVLEAVRAGAHGYLRKDTTPQELRQAVRAVHEGNAWFSPEVARHLATALRGDAAAAAPAVRESQAGPALVAQLTAREREILQGVAAGRTNKEMGAELGISVRTVEAHRDSIAKKTGVRSIAALTRLAIEAGIVRNP
jgi:DNA-binding NarL/FixJ family response regulator